jgi:hypothetical protein
LLLDPHGTPLGVRLMKYDTPIPMTAGAAAIAAMAHMLPSVTRLPSMTRLPSVTRLKNAIEYKTVSSEPAALIPATTVNALKGFIGRLNLASCEVVT